MPRHRLTTAGPGRPKGRLNDATVQVRLAAQRIVDDPEYRAALTRRIRCGKAAPAVETMLWHYAYGKPKDVIEHQGAIATDKTRLSAAELAAQASRILMRATASEAE